MRLTIREKRLVKGLRDVSAILNQKYQDVPYTIVYIARGKVDALLKPYLLHNRLCKRHDCKKEFTPKRKDQVFCSQACAHLDSVRKQRMKEKNEKGHHA